MKKCSNYFLDLIADNLTLASISGFEYALLATVSLNIFAFLISSLSLKSSLIKASISAKSFFFLSKKDKGNFFLSSIDFFTKVESFGIHIGFKIGWNIATFYKALWQTYKTYPIKQR